MTWKPPFDIDPQNSVNLPITTNYNGSQLNDTLASKLDLAGGKILQIVRATDSTDRSITSSTETDANISVTITPQKSDSAIFIIWSFLTRITGVSDQPTRGIFNITNSSNNSLSGANSSVIGMDDVTSSTTPVFDDVPTLIGYSTPATTSAITYKGRFRIQAAATGSAVIRNSTQMGQLVAIEVSA